MLFPADEDAIEEAKATASSTSMHARQPIKSAICYRYRLRPIVWL
jgi:hypothetical protein